MIRTDKALPPQRRDSGIRPYRWLTRCSHPPTRGGLRLSRLLDDSSDLRWVSDHRVEPLSVASLRIYSVHPSFGGLGLHLFQFVLALDLENQVARGIALEPDDEVGNVVMGLSIVQVGNREPEPRVLHKGLHQIMRIYKVRGGLLPLSRIRNDSVQVAVEDGPNVAARPEVHVRRGTWSPTGFVPWYLRGSPLGRVRPYSLQKPLDHPTVVR